ncbi:ABC transporter substrate-binding protein [Synechococcus sp. PROS-U-1]|uniref:ABC transporter substrate-binding protein n=1 Tax=Synechococcus sp. PROS-U-1 TaxID=1400866 RepID=UPI0016478CFB|nr:ABC transporter substrate-binding protein [Synechococcus sp. PROS-U-1]
MLLFLGGHLRRSSGITLTCWVLLSSGLLTLLQPRPVAAQSSGGGTDPNALVLGQSLPLSGPSAQLGLDYRRGALAWFEAVNREGGIHGRKIQLISLDDKYEPPQTLINTRQLLNRNDLLALFGYVGTPTTKVALPLIEEASVPLVAPMTGASLFRQPDLRMVFNMRTSYRREIAAMVDELVRDAHHRIAIVYQDDAFGQDGLDGALAALSRHGLKPVVVTTVQRNSAQVGEALDDLIATNPNGIVLVSAYVSSAALSSALRNRGSRAQIMNVSFVGTQALQKAMPVGEANGIGVAQVVPFPWNRWIPVVADYQRCLRLSDKSSGFGFTSFEGYLAARMITEALERAGKNPSRQALVQALESIRDLDLGGFRLQMGRDDHDASDFVELTFLGSQSWEP